VAQFKKGQSGNPKGRGKGARNKTTVMLERMMADDASDVMQSVIDAAKDGDMTAARIIVDRIAPVRKGRPLEIDIPSIAAPGDVVSAYASILGNLASGHLTPDEAQQVSAVVEASRKAIETEQLAQRIDDLERKIGQ